MAMTMTKREENSCYSINCNASLKCSGVESYADAPNARFRQSVSNASDMIIIGGGQRKDGWIAVAVSEDIIINIFLVPFLHFVWWLAVEFANF